MGNESSTSNIRDSRTQESPHAGSRLSHQHSTSNVPPGAYSVPGSQRRQAQFYVTVPAGIRPGQEFPVIANGQQLMVRCPPGIRPGERIVVSAPRSSQGTQAYMATVPHGVRSGEQFPVLVNNQQLMVTCPPGVYYVHGVFLTQQIILQCRCSTRHAGFENVGLVSFVT